LKYKGKEREDMSLTGFKEITEIAATRFADSPLGKLTESKSFDKPMSDYDEPLGIVCENVKNPLVEKDGYRHGGGERGNTGGDGKDGFGGYDGDSEDKKRGPGDSDNFSGDRKSRFYDSDDFFGRNRFSDPDDFFDGRKSRFGDYDDTVKKQEESIDKAKIFGVENLSTTEKGNFGEMCTDKDLREKGYERISKDTVTDVSESGHKGIDGVYENPDGNPRYLIVDSKYGSSQLQETQDGKQLSENWINERLDISVGKEKADEIRLERVFNPDNVGVAIAHVDKNGNVTYEAVDSNGETIEGKEVFQP
jgi:hypothetical protein